MLCAFDLHFLVSFVNTTGLIMQISLYKYAKNENVKSAL